jgi:hypothetical protein
MHRHITQFFINCSDLFRDIDFKTLKKHTAPVERAVNLPVGINSWVSSSVPFGDGGNSSPLAEASFMLSQSDLSFRSTEPESRK